MAEFSFRDWKTRNGLSNRTAADRLGINRRTVVRYVNGQLSVPYTTILACLAIEEGLDMADVKPVNMHKRMAMGEKVTGMKKGGAAKEAVHKHERVMHAGKPMTPLKKGGKPC